MDSEAQQFPNHGAARHHGAARVVSRVSFCRRSDLDCARSPQRRAEPQEGNVQTVRDSFDPTSSPLWNPDLAPTTPAQRTWSTYDIAALWIGMSVVISTYLLAAGFIQQGMRWWQALLTILLGNVIVLVPMVLNAHAGTRYGLSFPVLCRASFGTRGAHVPALARTIVACGWFGIQTWIGGSALDALLGAIWPRWTALGAHLGIAFALFWVLQVAILIRGMDGIKLLEKWGAPLLLLGGALLLVWAVRAAGGWHGLVRGADALADSSATARRDFWEIFWPGLTANVGYWATLSLNIPDFTRYARSQREQMLGQALGLPTTMFAFAAIGALVTSATLVVYGEAIWDPVELVKRFGNPAVIVFAALIILVAQITTNMAANVVAPATGISNLAPRRISFLAGSLVTAALGVAMLPWKLMQTAGSYIFTWLIGYSSLMGALAGILIADYWIVRRRQLDVNGLFDPNGPYAYANGFNRRALIAFVAGVVPVAPGFLRAASTPGGLVADPGFFDVLYRYAWFVTFGIAFALYTVLMRGRLRPAA
jgi:NCS1 family nucleobase:cation symporter-1